MDIHDRAGPDRSAAAAKGWSDRFWHSADGLQLHYRDYAGAADRAPVIVLHGLTRWARDGAELAGRLAAGGAAARPDPRHTAYANL